MDSRTRQDIAAATAIRHELGPDYEDAVAESLVERIGAEVDRRVDARLAQQGGLAPSPAPPPRPPLPAVTGRSGWPGVVLALGSMFAGLLATLGAMHNESSHDAGPVTAVVFIWIAIAVINIACARRR